jgi:hypothetical protein
VVADRSALIGNQGCLIDQLIFDRKIDPGKQRHPYGGICDRRISALIDGKTSFDRPIEGPDQGFFADRSIRPYFSLRGDRRKSALDRGGPLDRKKGSDRSESAIFRKRSTVFWLIDRSGGDRSILKFNFSISEGQFSIKGIQFSITCGK